MKLEYRLRLVVETSVDVDRDKMAEAVDAAVNWSTAREALSVALSRFPGAVGRDLEGVVRDVALTLIDEKEPSPPPASPFEKALITMLNAIRLQMLASGMGASPELRQCLAASAEIAQEAMRLVDMVVEKEE